MGSRPLGAHVVVEVDDAGLADPVERLQEDRPVVYLGWTGKDRDKYVAELVAGRAGPKPLRGAITRDLPDLYRHYPRTTYEDRPRQRSKLLSQLVQRGYRPWGRPLYRVYVGGLGPAAGDPRPRVYVGETSKPVPERWLEHRSGARTKGGRPKFSRVVHQHGLDLRPDLFEHYGPVATRDEARELERQLAHLLMYEGYRVEGNGTTHPPADTSDLTSGVPLAELLRVRDEID